MKIQCPKCRFEYGTVYTRKKYFIKSGLCFMMIPFSYLAYKLMAVEPDADPVVLIGIFGGLGGIVIFPVLGIYNFRRGILTKVANYKCWRCKNRFVAPLSVGR